MPSTSSSLAIGVDIGGSKVAGGVVDVSGQIVLRAGGVTPDLRTSPAVVNDQIVSVITSLRDQAAKDPALADATIDVVGIGAAGFVAADRATIVFAPHLSWRNEPLRDSLQHRIDLPIYIDNDANAALWAEHRFGAATSHTRAVMITLGTGIGGALLIDGRIHRGRFGMAGEFGHMQVVPGGLRCECGNRGCWEQYASGNALVRETRALMAAGSPAIADFSERVGGDPSNLTGPMITEAAAAGDRMAQELLCEVGEWLGSGLASLGAALDTGLFVIGGGVSAAGDLLLTPAREAYAKQLPGRGFRPLAPIVAASLGNDAGMIGAADLAREERRESSHE